MKAVIKREKEAGITPDPDIDAYMKVNTNILAHQKGGKMKRRKIN
jgi:hypothetical protein